MRRAKEWIGEKGDVRGWSQVAILFNSSVFGEQQVRVRAERNVSVRVYLLWSLKFKISLPLLYSREIHGKSTGIH